MINVTKTFLPPLSEYVERLARVWDAGVITNHGPATGELEAALRDVLGATHCLLVSNGTLAIQLAVKALGLSGEIITTPFSYVATTSSVVWEGCTPVFADIDAATLTIDPERVEAAITPRTSAILATHVYGHPCDVDGLADVAHRLSYMRNFGHDGPEAFQGVGINAKISELHSIMGLCVLPHIPEIIARRRAITERYDAALGESPCVRRPQVRGEFESNYAYYPVVYATEAALLRARTRMNAVDICPRRYFYPSLSELPYVAGPAMPVAEDLSRRVLCLPLSAALSDDDADRVAGLAFGG